MFNRVLPQTPVMPVRIAVVISTAILSLGAVFRLIDYAHTEVPQLVVALFMCVVSFFLWRLQHWARIAAQWLLAIIAFSTSFAIFLNPFFLTDYEAANGGAEPSWPVLLAYLFLLGVPSAWCWWVFHTYRSAFRSAASA